MLRQPAAAAAPRPQRAPPKRRGSYNCGRCGLPKKGHVCHLPADTNPSSPAIPTPPPPRSDLRLRRALSFDDNHVADSRLPDDVVGALPVSCLAEILRRLSPKELMGAAAVCKGWREVIRRVWISAEEIKLKVNPRSQIGFVGSVLNKCAGLGKLTLTMERLWKITIGSNY